MLWAWVEVPDPFHFLRIIHDGVHGPLGLAHLLNLVCGLPRTGLNLGSQIFEKWQEIIVQGMALALHISDLDGVFLELKKLINGARKIAWR